MATKKSQSPQSKWARKMQRLGRCRICGKKRDKFKWLCDEHGGKFTQYMKQYRSTRKANKETNNVLAQAAPVPQADPDKGDVA